MIRIDNALTADEILSKHITVPTRDEINRPAGNKDNWQPYSHAEMLTALHKALDYHGIQHTNNRFFVSDNGYRMMGLMDITLADPPKLPDSISASYQLGIRSSTDMSHSIQVYGGIEIGMCSNGCMFGTIVDRKKHTTGFYLSEQMLSMTRKWQEQANQTVFNCNAMSEIDLTIDQSNEIILQAGRQNIMPWSRVGKLDKEYGHPTFESFDHNRLWDLYNAGTYVAQEASPDVQLQTIKDWGKHCIEATATTEGK